MVSVGSKSPFPCCDRNTSKCVGKIQGEELQQCKYVSSFLMYSPLGYKYLGSYQNPRAPSLNHIFTTLPTQVLCLL